MAGPPLWSTMTDHNAAYYGGAIFAVAGTAELGRCTITRNSVLYTGDVVDKVGSASPPPHDVVFSNCNALCPMDHFYDDWHMPHP